MKTSILLFCIIISFLFISGNKASQQEYKARFIHPGILNTTRNLDLVREQLNTNINSRIRSFAQVNKFIKSNPYELKYPKIVASRQKGATSSETQMRKDAMLAYALAIKWSATGNPEDAKQAKYILNGWAVNFERYEAVKGTSAMQSQLEASWVLPTFIAAAEIIRYYRVSGKQSGWKISEIEKFNSFLSRLYNNYVSKLANVALKTKGRHNNWGSSAAYAKMAYGVYFNDTKSYEDGKRLIKMLIPILISNSGQVLELCERDCYHPQYTMAGLTLAAEIAYNQKDASIYEASNQRIKTGWEWMSKALKGNLDCRDCSKSNLFSSIELANKYYRSTTINNLIKAKSPIPYRKNSTFIEFATYTHGK